MASSARIVNLTSGFTLKRHQATSRIEHCISAWVEFGVSIRDLTMTERFERRAQARAEDDHSPMPFAELPSTIYRPAEYAQASHQEEIRLIQQTNSLYACECAECTQKRADEAKRSAAEAKRFMRTSAEPLGVGG